MKGMIALWIVFLDAKWLCASYNVTFATSLVLLFGVRAGGTSLPERHVITAQETVVVVIEPFVGVGCAATGCVVVVSGWDSGDNRLDSYGWGRVVVVSVASSTPSMSTAAAILGCPWCLGYGGGRCCGGGWRDWRRYRGSCG